VSAGARGAGVSARAKLVSLRRARALRERARSRGQRVVFTNGCFDLLHLGHLRFLERARSEGDLLFVALNSDASVRRLKGRDRPIVPARQRAELVAGLAAVDFVLVFGSDTPLALIRALAPDVLVKGAEWRVDQIAGAGEVLAAGGRVVRVPVLRGVRTSRILARARRARRT
jgi:D-beta-D-heptose 7-phosphate kinase/D-beta-D-heptose 1-phosphate adenosyltransferase